MSDTSTTTPAPPATPPTQGQDQQQNESDTGRPPGNGITPAPEGEALGEAGTRALATMKEQLRAERRARQAAEQALADAGAKDEAEREALRAQRETETKALAAANRRILQAEVRSAAKGVLADPADALTFLDLDGFEVQDDGQTDPDSISAALRQLVAAKPYLAAEQPRFQGTGDGGARDADQSPKSQLTREQLAKMSPDERLKAFDEGRCRDLTGG